MEIVISLDQSITKTGISVFESNECDDDFKLIDSMLEVYTPGVYSIEAVYEDKMFAMNLRVENAYLQNKADGSFTAGTCDILYCRDC